MIFRRVLSHQISCSNKWWRKNRGFKYKSKKKWDFSGIWNRIKSIICPADSVCKQTIQTKLPWYICLSILFLCCICLLSRRLKRASVYYTDLKLKRTNILSPIANCVQHNLVQYWIISLSMKQTHSMSCWERRSCGHSTSARGSERWPCTV